MNTFTNMALKTRTWCYSFDQYVRKCNDRLVVNMINKNCIVFPDAWHLLCYCCCVKHPAHCNSKSRVYPLPSQTRDHRRKATLPLLLVVFAAGVAVRC